MLTGAAILAFIKGQARITNTAYDAQISLNIAYSYQRFASRRLWPGLRVTNTFTTTTAQSYAIGAVGVIGRLYDDSVKYDYSATTGTGRVLDVVNNDQAEVWASLEPVVAPYACSVIAGSTGETKMLALWPTFTETGKVVSYTYQKDATITSFSDVLDLPELAYAVAFDVLSLDKDLQRDNDAAQADYSARSRRAYLDAIN